SGADAVLSTEEHRRQISELEARSAALAAERTRLIALVDDLQQTRRLLEAERDAAGAARAAAEAKLQHAIAETRAAAADQQRRDREALEALTARHADAVAEGERATALAAELRRLSDEHSAARAHMERALADARADAATEREQDRRRLEDAE